MKTLSSDFEEIIKRLGLFEKMKLELLRKEFDKLIPPPLSDHIIPSYLKNGHLLIVVDSREWMNEVRLQESVILRRLSPHGIRTVRFKLGRIFKKKKVVTPPRPSSVKVPDDMIDDAASYINDADLRRSLLKAVKASLSRGRGA